MRCFDGSWYFELTPTYLFTEDGIRRHYNDEILLKGIKRMERHPAVLGSFLLWKEFLTDYSLFDFRYPFLKVCDPISLSINRGIDDGAWRTAGAEEETPPPDAADEEEMPENTDDGGLFSWKPT